MRFHRALRAFARPGAAPRTIRSVLPIAARTTGARTSVEDRRREGRDGRSRGICRAGSKGRARGATSRRCRLAVVGRAPRRADVSRPLPRRNAAPGRAHQHQPGGGRFRRVRPLARQLRQRARQRQCPPCAGKLADCLHRRNCARGRDRAGFFLDRRAHEHAVQGLSRRGKPGAVVRAAAGRGRGLVDSGLSEIRPAQYHDEMERPRLADRSLLHGRTDRGVRHVLRAVRLHVHRLGAAQHGPEPGGGGGGRGRRSGAHAVYRHVSR